MEDFNQPPVYDPVTEDGKHMSDVYQIWIAEHVQTLIGYLTTLGIFMPRITTATRDSINTPTNGTIIYNTTVDAPQIYQGGIWKTFTTV
jgi:hypothetical protein